MGETKIVPVKRHIKMISLRSIAVLTFIVVSTCTYDNYNNGDMRKGHIWEGQI